MPYTTLREAGECVRRKQIFTGNNVYGRWFSDGGSDHWYVVFSYGTHFPMFLFDMATEQWFGNRERYSRTTSRHQGACSPPHIDHWLDTPDMQRLACSGLRQCLKARLRIPDVELSTSLTLSVPTPMEDCPA